jgi:hypothetical protein
MELFFILFYVCLNMSFAKSVDERRWANCVALHYPYYLVPLNFHFWGYVEDKMCSQRINMLV